MSLYICLRFLLSCMVTLNKFFFKKKKQKNKPDLFSFRPLNQIDILNILARLVYTI